MKKTSSTLVLLLGLINFIYTANSDHLLLSAICIDPFNAEMIQIYNPTDDTIYLNSNEGKYYLTDATDNNNDKYYYNYPLGNDYAIDNSNGLTDFFISFPEDSKIKSGETITLGLHSSILYLDYYSLSNNPIYNDCLIDSYNQNCGVPDYNLIDLVDSEIDCESISNEEDCIAGCFWSEVCPDGSLNINECISEWIADPQYTCINVQNISQNISILGPEETLILFFWDGTSELVQDVDYISWGGASEAVDKSGIVIGSSSFNSDIPIENQSFLSEIDANEVYSRISYDEYEESFGNGINGDNETSEDFNLTWEIKEAIASGCTNPGSANYNHEAIIDDGSCYVLTHSIASLIQSIPEIPDGLSTCDLTGPDQSSNQQSQFLIDATISGKVVGYKEYPFVIVALEDVNGYRIEINGNGFDGFLGVPVSEGGNGLDGTSAGLDGLDQTEDDIELSNLVDPTNPIDYVVGVSGTLCHYDGRYQFEVYDRNDIVLLDEYNTHGVRTQESDEIVNAKIETKPYVIIPSRGERLDFKYSFPSESRVIIRIFDLNGNFFTSLVDQYYETGGTVERFEDESSWDGRNHHGQLATPGTYLMQIEASNFKTGRTSTDITPIVVGAYH